MLLSSLQLWNYLVEILYAIIAMQVVKQIDYNLLAPKFVGNSVGLHAVFTMIAILIGVM